MEKHFGPSLPISEEIHAMKYRSKGESFSEAAARFAHTLADDAAHFRRLYNILLEMRFLGGGRTQAAIGSPRDVTAFNCFVSGTIKDSFDDIMDKAKEAGKTMRKGGGIGYGFSSLRPRGDLIVSLDSRSSGPISFMQIFDSVCQTIASAGHRRGAQMAVLNIWHPDIEEFIRAKQNETNLRGFNISIGVTDKFMDALIEGKPFNLEFNGRVYKQVSSTALWEEVMRATWDWAEPGVLFIDRINEMNNLWYCENIEATNPCGEQPLPPYGACLLGSFNLVKYIRPMAKSKSGLEDLYEFDYEALVADIPDVVRAMDNIIDNTTYPLPEQEVEAKNKRRMGLGVTGVANAGEILGFPYASHEFMEWLKTVLEVIRNECYHASTILAKEKGCFPLFDADQYLQGKFIQTLPDYIRDDIQRYGIRNSHLLSVAPTGTISLAADNISSGIEPVFSLYYDRTIQTFDGPIVERVEDYAYREYGVKGKTAAECTAEDHLRVLALTQQYIDSAVSKTINVNPEMAWNEFKDIYLEAYRLGCKGVTTFNPAGKRYGVLNKVEVDEDDSPKAEACYIDKTTGKKSCD